MSTYIDYEAGEASDGYESDELDSSMQDFLAPEDAVDEEDDDDESSESVRPIRKRKFKLQAVANSVPAPAEVHDNAVPTPVAPKPTQVVVEDESDSKQDDDAAPAPRRLADLPRPRPHKRTKRKPRIGLLYREGLGVKLTTDLPSVFYDDTIGTVDVKYVCRRVFKERVGTHMVGDVCQRLVGAETDLGLLAPLCTSCFEGLLGVSKKTRKIFLRSTARCQVTEEEVARLLELVQGFGAEWTNYAALPKTDLIEQSSALPTNFASILTQIRATPAKSTAEATV